MVATLKMIYKSRKLRLDYTIVPTMFDRRTGASAQSLETLRDQYSAELWESVIPVDIKLRDASRAGVPASNCYPGSRAVVAYSALLEFLMQKERVEELRAVAS